MPKLMDKHDWIQTVANVSAAGRGLEHLICGC